MDVLSVANGPATHDTDTDAEESLLHILLLVLFLLISIWVNGIASDTLFRVRSKVECNIFLGHMIDLAVM